MASSPRAPGAVPGESGEQDPVVHLESALAALRREWRAGFRDRIAIATAQGQLRRLRPFTATHQATSALASLEAALGAYERMGVADRPEALKRLAAGMESLRPNLLPLDAPPAMVGKLATAIAPGMAPAPASKPRTGPHHRPTPPLAPSDPVTALPKVGPTVAKHLAAHRAKIITVGDLLGLAPSRHIDYSRTEPIGAALRSAPGTDVTVRGTLTEIREIRTGGPPRVQARLSDGTGWMRITWFSAFIAKQLQAGDQIVVSGTIEADFGPLSFTNPEWEPVGGAGLSTGRLTPVYPLTKGLHQKSMRTLTRAALDATESAISDPLPPEILARYDLVGAATAYEDIHYPVTWAGLGRAQSRLAFEDLFLLQIGHIRRRRDRKRQPGTPLSLAPELRDLFMGTLPYRLTGAQDRALAEILADLDRPEPMTRLLQGDVGSGKTVVAATAALAAASHAYQVALMAPTEILAEQHFHNVRGLYAALPEADRPVVELLTGSVKGARRKAIQAGLLTGEVDVLVGTQALIQNGVEFARLGLAIVDEQHRFGVRQRADLTARPDPGASDDGVAAVPAERSGVYPHTLAMTATPIPRTLNLVLNGDLDVSVIAELPPGRTPIETRRYGAEERLEAYHLVRTQVAAGHQVFVICPLVEESEAIEAKAAVAEAARLQAEVFPELRVGLLHGRMASRDKDATMTAFRDRAYDILVATSVIEVGIDVPNATVMMIEGADRFGLSQLHQFRGRVGRGAARSFCLLLAAGSAPDAEARLQTMVDTSDGFILAQKDLELRGPGDFIGTRQSGLPELSWLDGSFDTRLLDKAREAAEALLETDPDLSRPEHQPLARRLAEFWFKASPDIPL